ncbi:MAG: transcription elongation factor GreA [Armatimonadota bacterium]|nr:MAG: transcription elongation factor GreA [Armatimonadota bacterium]
MADSVSEELHQGLIVTPEGYQKLRDELEHLKTVQRKEVANRIREAPRSGELTDNSEYEEAKSEQAYVEGRILELQRLLQNAVVVARSEGPPNQVRLGSVVKLKDKAGKRIEYKIVGPVEADPANQRISYQSPVGQALVGHGKGDKVTVATPSGKASYTIMDVKN